MPRETELIGYPTAKGFVAELSRSLGNRARQNYGDLIVADEGEAAIRSSVIIVHVERAADPLHRAWIDAKARLQSYARPRCNKIPLER
jgi:hypothetical protein